MQMRQSTEYDEEGSIHDGGVNAEKIIKSKEQNHMQSTAGDRGAWSPSEVQTQNNRSAGK